MKSASFKGGALAIILVFAAMSSACSKEPAPADEGPKPNVDVAKAEAEPAPVATDAVPVTASAPAILPAAAYSPEALETLLAPVALYPDAVLAQVLASSTNPQEVLDAGNWLIANPDTKGKELEAAATAVGLTPPMISLMHFPSVVDMMCMKMDWTTELGDAFQSDETGVLAAVQRLRKQAAEMGNLTSSEQMKVTTEEQNNEKVIVVEPANPEVVYVPQYSPTAAYTTPAPMAAPATTTTTVVEDTDEGYSGGEMVAAGLLAFGGGMLVNEVFSDDDDDYDDYYRPNWGYGGSGYYPPPYAPRYGNGYRPANRYNRPVNYERGFNNNNVYVDADGKDYFNKFEGGKNNYRKNGNSPITAARPNRPELGELNKRPQSGQRPKALPAGDKNKLKGQYAGAKPGARPNNVARSPAVASKIPKGTYAGATNPAARKRLNPQTAGARDRGHTAIKREKPALRQQSGGAKIAKPAAHRQNVSRPATRKAPARNPSAFQGSRNRGTAERAASNRGRASMAQGGRQANRGNSGQRRGNRR